jgi:toxin HigB-1
MIKSFRHKGLLKLYELDSKRGLNPKHVEKITRILARLDQAIEAADMDLPGYRLHQLKGSLRGFWSVTVSANWRIIFKLGNGDVTEVDYLDYH